MARRDFHKIIDAILKDDKRYGVGAYVFVRMALDYTVKKFSEEKESGMRKGSHVNGRELAEGAREFAIDTFGPMAAVLFKDWGIKDTGDFGEIVFNMIKVGEMSKQDEDKIEDFSNIYDFYDAFERPFLPKSKGGL